MYTEALRKKWMNRYPRVSDLEEKCRQRVPFVAWQYLKTGTGQGHSERSNHSELDRITFLPRFMKGKITPDPVVNLFGQTYAMPFGVAPIGMPGLVWPGADVYLARMAHRQRIPYCLSTVGTETPEVVGKEVGDMGWFQLYPPADVQILKDLLERVKGAGFRVLVFTADIPLLSRREDSRKSGFTMPPKITARLIGDGLLHPAWSLKMLSSGFPRLKTVEPYSPSKDMKTVAVYARYDFRAAFDWEYLERVRELWQGPLILKGILHPEDVQPALQLGVDAIGVSNHGGRQFDGAPAAILALPGVAEEVAGRVPVLFDSGINTGLDIIRAVASGADFVLVGRPFMYGLGALGERGAEHVFEVLKDELHNNMVQLGVKNMQEVAGLAPFQAKRLPSPMAK